MQSVAKLQEDHGKYFSQSYVDERARKHRENPFHSYIFDNLIKYDIVMGYVEIVGGEHNGEYKCRPCIILNPSVDIAIDNTIITGSQIIPITSTYNSKSYFDKKFKIPFKNDRDVGLDYSYKSYMNLVNYHDNFFNNSIDILALRKDYMETKIGHLPEIDQDSIDEKYDLWIIEKSKQ